MGYIKLNIFGKYIDDLQGRIQRICYHLTYESWSHIWGRIDIFSYLQMVCNENAYEFS